MATAVWIGVAGFFGAIARYAIQGLVSRINETVPWGTLVVNVSGSFLLGLLVVVLSHHIVVHPDLRVAITVGFLGAYTTFSTLTLETYEFMEIGDWGYALMNLIGSVVLGMIAVWLGTKIVS